MPIAFDGGRRGGSSSFGRRDPCCAPAAAAAGGSSSAGRGSDSRAAVLQCDEVESDGEVQSSYRGPFDTMDALQDALPSSRKGVSKFYNGKSSSVADVASHQPPKEPANPGNPSPKKRKGLLPFSFSWSKSRSKESSSRNCRKTLAPDLASCTERSSRGNNEHGRSQDPARRSLQLPRRPDPMDVCASPPAALRSQLISVQMRSLSVTGLEEVAESTASASPREKRRKSLQ